MVDQGYSNMERELREIKLENQRMAKQLIATQEVFKNVSQETNQCSRNQKQFNIRLGKIASPITPEMRGQASAKPPREDTREIVAKWIDDNTLYPGKKLDDIRRTIDAAFRTGKPMTGKVRNILVKFTSTLHRNIAMK